MCVGGNEDGGWLVAKLFQHSHQSWNACLGFEIRRGMGGSSVEAQVRSPTGAGRAPQGLEQSPTGAANQFGGKISSWRQLGREEWMLQNMAICNRQIP